MNLRQAAEIALETLISLEELIPVGSKLAAIDILQKALAQLDKKCEASPSLQDLWDCWDAVHGGQKPVAYMKQWPPGRWEQCSENYAGACPVYLHPAPIPEGWQLVPKEPTINMLNALYYSERSKGYAAMLAAAPKYEEQEK